MSHIRNLYLGAISLLFCMVFLSGVFAPVASAGYLPPDDFFEVETDYEISVMAVQSTPNTPITNSTGLKGIMLSLLGPYDPPVTQFRYQSNTSTNYTYVNDIQPDYVWMCSAAVFAIVLYCVFRMGGAALCKL